jgi:hypothetical protein
MKLKIVERFRAWRHERQQKTAEEIAGMSAADREAMRAGEDMPHQPSRPPSDFFPR